MIQTFTPEELAELAAFDAEVDDEPLTMDELRASRERDRGAELDAMDSRRRTIAERNRQYYEANKDAIAERKRQYYEANKDAIAERNRQYREANKDAIAERKRQYYEANKDRINQRKREQRVKRRQEEQA